MLSALTGGVTDRTQERGQLPHVNPHHNLKSFFSCGLKEREGGRERREKSHDWITAPPSPQSASRSPPPPLSQRLESRTVALIAESFTPNWTKCQKWKRADDAEGSCRRKHTSSVNDSEFPAVIERMLLNKRHICLHQLTLLNYLRVFKLFTFKTCWVVFTPRKMSKSEQMHHINQKHP